MVAKIYGHRGASGEKPDNTMAGFLHARSVGVAGVETDIVLTKDLVPVLHHDMHLADGRFIPDVPANELPPVIPNLSQALREVEGIEWLLEIKRPLPLADRMPSPALIVERILGHLMQADRARVQAWSFDWEVLREFGQQAPEVSLGCFTGNRIDIAANCEDYLREAYLVSDISAGLAGVGVKSRGAFHGRWNDAEIRSAKSAGLKVFACFVNEPADFDRLLHSADGIITDWPSRFCSRNPALER